MSLLFTQMKVEAATDFLNYVAIVHFIKISEYIENTLTPQKEVDIYFVQEQLTKN